MGRRPIDQALHELREWREEIQADEPVDGTIEDCISIVERIASEYHEDVTERLQQAIQDRQDERERWRERVANADSIEEVVDLL